MAFQSNSNEFKCLAYLDLLYTAVQQQGWRDPLRLQPGHESLRGEMIAHADGAQLVLVLQVEGVQRVWRFRVESRLGQRPVGIQLFREYHITSYRMNPLLLEAMPAKHI